MGYGFFCGIPLAVGAGLAIVMGSFITLEILEDWAEVQLSKNRGEPNNLDTYPFPADKL